MDKLPELKYLGHSVEWHDYGQYEYKGYCISFHLTITGNTRLRLELNKNDDFSYSCLCDWCLGGSNYEGERVVSDLYLIIGSACMLYCIDNGLVGEMPHHSELKPMWNDDRFTSWLHDVFKKVDFPFFHAVRDRVFQDIDRPGFVKLILNVL
jgi:hypothetical protein